MYFVKTEWKYFFLIRRTDKGEAMSSPTARQKKKEESGYVISIYQKSEHCALVKISFYIYSLLEKRFWGQEEIASILLDLLYKPITNVHKLIALCEQ